MKQKIGKLGMSLALLAFMGNLTAVAGESKFTKLTEGTTKAWTNITVPSDETTLEDLASTYYGDVKEATLIYTANRGIIPVSKTLHKGMILKMPLTSKYRDQPEHLGWN